MKFGNHLKLEIMKTILKAIAASALLVLAGCAKDINTDKVNPETRTVVVNAGPVATKVNFTDDGTSKVEVKWNDEGETFDAFIGNSETAPKVTFEQISAPDESGNVRFQADIPADTPDDAMIYAIYPGADVKSTSPKNVRLLVGEETGTMDETRNFMYATSSLADLEDPSKNLQFTHLTSLIKVTMDFGAEAEGSATAVSVVADNLMRIGYIDITEANPVVTPDAGKIGYIPISGTFELEGGKATVYVHVLPATLSSLEISAKLGEEHYKATLSGKELVAGKVYNVNATMAVAGVVEYKDLVMGMKDYTEGGQFLSASDGVVYTKEEAASNSAVIDIVSFYSAASGKAGYALTSPSTTNANSAYGTGTWANKNATSFKRLANPEEITGTIYNGYTKASQLEERYNSASAEAVEVVNTLAKNEMIAFKTASGKYGILMITGKDDHTKVKHTGTITIKYKIAE